MRRIKLGVPLRKTLRFSAVKKNLTTEGTEFTEKSAMDAKRTAYHNLRVFNPTYLLILSKSASACTMVAENSNA